MNESECEMIHSASLALLDDPGVKMEHDRVCGLLLKAGAREGTDAQVIRFPREMVSELLALAPETVELTDRAGGRRELTATSPPLYWTIPGLNVERDGATRPFTSKDMADIARLADRLENVHGVFGFSMADVPPAARDFVGLRIMAENTTKHLRALCFTPRGAEAMMEMRQALGDHPWFSVGFTAHGPLRWTGLALEIFLKSAGSGTPVTVNGEPMAGATGPVTLAGSVAVGNAEILAGICANQVIEPGRPCIHNMGLAHVMDMRRALTVTGGPENALLAAAGADMARFYGLPSCSWVSTESMTPDSQAALEKMCGFLTHAQAGVSLIWGVGQLESEMTISPAQMVIDNETIAFAERYLRGFDVNEDTIALDLTRDVGIGGSFLATEHTLKNFRESILHPGVLCRMRRENWAEQGAKTLRQAAQDKADELIASAPGAGLDEDQKKALKEIEDRYLAEL